MSCKCARGFLEHTCTVTGDRCIYVIPDSVACRVFFNEGPDVNNNDKLYTILLDDNGKCRLYAGSSYEAKKIAIKFYGRRVIRVLPLFKELDFVINYNCGKPQFTVDYLDRNILRSNNNIIFRNNTDDDNYIIEGGIESIRGVAITENYILIQHDTVHGLKQRRVKITEDIKNLL